jgi:hypothetical protein
LPVAVPRRRRDDRHAVSAQGNGPRFKAGVQLVRIDVSVLDGKRQPVRWLVLKKTETLHTRRGWTARNDRSVRANFLRKPSCGDETLPVTSTVSGCVASNDLNPRS